MKKAGVFIIDANEYEMQVTDSKAEKRQNEQ
jgi:hypothetical protein